MINIIRIDIFLWDFPQKSPIFFVCVVILEYLCRTIRNFMEIINTVKQILIYCVTKQ